MFLSFPVQALGLVVDEVFTVEKKATAIEFLQSNTIGSHNYTSIEAVLQSIKNPADGCPECTTHAKARACTLPSHTQDMAIIGFPCSPFSGQRTDRWKGGSEDIGRELQDAFLPQTQAQVVFRELSQRVGRYKVELVELVIVSDFTLDRQDGQHRIQNIPSA